MSVLQRTYLPPISQDTRRLVEAEQLLLIAIELMASGFGQKELDFLHRAVDSYFERYR